MTLKPIQPANQRQPSHQSNTRAHKTQRSRKQPRAPPRDSTIPPRAKFVNSPKKNRDIVDTFMHIWLHENCSSPNGSTYSAPRISIVFFLPDLTYLLFGQMTAWSLGFMKKTTTWSRQIKSLLCKRYSELFIGCFFFFFVFLCFFSLCHGNDVGK